MLCIICPNHDCGRAETLLDQNYIYLAQTELRKIVPVCKLDPWFFLVPAVWECAGMEENGGYLRNLGSLKGNLPFTMIWNTLATTPFHRIIIPKLMATRVFPFMMNGRFPVWRRTRTWLDVTIIMNEKLIYQNMKKL